jgi:hypothetical protein
MLGPGFRLAITLVFMTLFLRGNFLTIVSGITTEQGIIFGFYWPSPWPKKPFSAATFNYG